MLEKNNIYDVFFVFLRDMYEFCELCFFTVKKAYDILSKVV